MVRLYAALLCMALSLGCSSEPPPLDAKGELVVEQTVLEFPRTFVGYTTTVDLVVTNTGFTEIPIELSLTGYFSMPRGRERIERGEVRALKVTFNPEFAGAQTGVLTMLVDGEEKRVLLQGLAEPPPPCNPSAPCRATEFDPVTGECTESVLPNGEACTSGNQCQIQESCLDGICVGKQRNCGDNDVCTADACDPQRGCIHVDQSSGCPTPSNPCKVAVCDPDDGCGQADAVDYTLCGPSDCREALVCLGGECERIGEDLLEGTPCVDECGMGACESGECERPEGDALKQLWSYAPEAGTEVLFPGLSDGAGQLYWIERTPGSQARFVSATPGGIIRYRTAVSFPGPVLERGLVLEDGVALAAAAEAPVVAAFVPRDGSMPWRRDLQPQLDEAIAGCPCDLEGGALTRSETGRALFSANVHVGGAAEASHTFLAMIRSGSGEVAWSDGIDAPLLAPPLADEAGNLYLLLPAAPGEAALVSLDPGGEERWRVTTARDALPLLAFDGAIHQAIDRILATEDGGPVRRLQFTQPHGTSPLAGDAGSWSFTTSPEGNLLARAFDAEGASTSVTPLLDPGTLGGTFPPVWSEPLLTLRDTALLSTSSASTLGVYQPVLREIQRDGDVKRVCTMGFEGTVSGGTSLRAGRWVVRAELAGGTPQLRAYELPHGDTAPRGWVGPFGNPAGGGRPQ